MDKKYLFIGASIFILFIVGMLYLAHLDKTTPTGADARFLAYADKIGLDKERFSADLLAIETDNRIKNDVSEGNKLQISSTPTFIVNGETVRFTQSLEKNQEIIDTVIAKNESPEIPEGHSKGSTDPKVVITKFSDFQCPACGQIVSPMRELVAANPDTVTYIYKNFPLPMHQYARSAAKAAEAAANQGKFWEMHDILFEERREWSR